MRHFWLGIALAMVVVTPSHALEPGTMDAVLAAVAIGAAVSGGEIDGGLASSVVRSLQKDKVPNAAIGDLFRAMVDPAGIGSGGPSGPGMGAFVQEMHRRGLRGRALAQAIHEEQARRGIPGHAKRNGSTVIVVPDPDDDNPGVGNRNRRKVPPGLSNR
jgi:hypothetical protein